MKHHFISVYYNYCKYASRQKLTSEFCSRYPQVHLIELAFDDPATGRSEPFVINAPNSTQIRTTFSGFVNNQLINNYVNKNIKTLKSLTFIDSDLLLDDQFFTEMISKLDDNRSVPTFIQGFSLCSDILPTGYISTYLPSSAKNYCEHLYPLVGHSGYIYSYNRPLLLAMGALPECMLLGGWDTIWWMTICKQRQKIIELGLTAEVNDEIMKFYSKSDQLKIKIDYLPLEVKHFHHGNKAKRYNGRFDLYKSAITQEIINKYFYGRDEDTDW